MRLLRAHFENFRLLRDLDLEFSSDAVRKLTVIRAANETGKTTILHALQWGLYGDDALPGQSRFRLHPIDWDLAGGTRVPVTVSIEFEAIRYHRAGGQVRESRRRYRIIRSATEELSGTEYRRTPSTVQLFHIDDKGATAIDPPEAFINDELPPELREVFFTDGDRALSFIESTVSASTKRERVQAAIRSLLGLGLLDDAIRHVKKAAADVNREARGMGGDAQLTKVAGQLDALNEESLALESNLADAHAQFTAFDEKLGDVDKKIDDALKRGDRDKLRRDKDASIRALSKLDERILAANRDHSHLFRTEALARDILAPVLATAFGQLKALHDKGKIPNTTIPVLEERLAVELCICGESLHDDSAGGSARRAHISHLIDQSRQADQVQEIVTDLYYGSRSLEQRGDDKDRTWLALYKKVVQERDGLQGLRDDEGQKLKALETQIDSLPDTDIQGLRDVQRQYREQRDRFNAQKAKIETQLENNRRQRQQLELDRDRLLRAQRRGAKILAELEVAGDVQAVLQRSYDRITNEELAKVSSLMNTMFLEMIGSDPEQGAIIKKATISPEFDIVVLGPSSRLLNPDRDLNGASRRALTLAFILALTKVSEVEAPNVIDTPLGMMSGYVKRSVLRTAIRESTQLILFLTPSEIAGCEEIIDDAAGRVYTLTNSAHYPKMLVNDPRTTDRRVLRCTCTHRQHCPLCERLAEVDALDPVS